MSLHTRTSDMALGRWSSILPQLGVPASVLSGKHQPCPICGGDDRFRYDNKDGRGAYICGKCGAGDGIDLVAGFLGLSKPDAMRRVDEIIGSGSTSRATVKSGPTDEQKIEWARRLWSSGRKIEKGSPADAYLTSREIGEKDYTELRSLRFVDALKYDEDLSFPAMIAAVQGADGKLCAVHRTFLAVDGSGKADVPSPKKVLGVLTAGSAIRFSPPQETLGIAEGIETAMSASAMFSLPVWASVTANGLRNWAPPHGCKEVAIFADADESFTGQSAAYDLAFRLRRDGFSVSVHLPDRLGADWADMYASQSHGERR